MSPILSSSLFEKLIRCFPDFGERRKFGCVLASGKGSAQLRLLHSCVTLLNSGSEKKNGISGAQHCKSVEEEEIPEKMAEAKLTSHFKYINGADSLVEVGILDFDATADCKCQEHNSISKELSRGSFLFCKIEYSRRIFRLSWFLENDQKYWRVIGFRCVSWCWLAPVCLLVLAC